MRQSSRPPNAKTPQLVLLTVAISVACFPVVPVPPAVEPGFRVSIGATTHYTEQRESWIPDSTQVKPEVSPQAKFLASVGVVGSDPSLPRLRASDGTAGSSLW